MSCFEAVVAVAIGFAAYFVVKKIARFVQQTRKIHEDRRRRGVVR